MGKLKWANTFNMFTVVLTICEPQHFGSRPEGATGNLQPLIRQSVVTRGHFVKDNVLYQGGILLNEAKGSRPEGARQVSI